MDDISHTVEELEGLDLGEPKVTEETNYDLCLVCKLLTGRSINVQAMKNTLASIWRPRHRVKIKVLGGYCCLFFFKHEFDIQRAIEGAP